MVAASSSFPPPLLSAKIHPNGYTCTRRQLLEARLFLQDAQDVPWSKRLDLVINTHATFAFGLRWGLLCAQVRGIRGPRRTPPDPWLSRSLVDVSPWRKSSRISCKRRFAIAIRMRTHGPCFEMRSRRGSDGWRHITLSRSCTPCLRSSRCKSPLPVSSLPSASDLDLEKQGHCTSRRLHVGKVSPRQVLAHAYTSGNGRHLSGGTLFEWMDDSLPALPRCLARLHLVRSSLSCSLCALLTSWCRQTVFYNEGKWVPNSDIWRTIIWMPGWTAFWLATWSLCVSRKSPTSPL